MDVSALGTGSGVEPLSDQSKALMSEPEPWRKTGRKAKEDHWLGLAEGVILELAVYDDAGAQQGRLVALLQSKGEAGAHDEGQIWLAEVLAIEDPYFDYWHGKTYGENLVPVHACGRQGGRCGVQTLYRNPLHMDVFRILPGRTAMGLSWLSDEEKVKVEKALASLGHAGTAPGGPPPGDNAGAPEGAVALGEEGLRGLAEALGSAPTGDRQEQKEVQRTSKKRDRDKSVPAKEKTESSHTLADVLKERKAAEPELSALKMPQGKKDGKKKKRKKRRAKGHEDGATSSSSSSDTSSEESVFRLAALPQGVEKLQRLHQEKPGTLANLTLRRFNELLSRSVGRGSAEVTSDLPAVARAYLTQIYLVKSPETTIGMRNLRELRTLATMVDMMATNDPLRAMDVALQRMKAIELFVSQGNWTQATVLELIPAEGEQRAWFRQELKAAQQEAKAENKLLSDQWPRRRRTWEVSSGGGAAPGEEKRGTEEKGDTPPQNGPKIRKGKGKGKKGKRW